MYVNEATKVHAKLGLFALATINLFVVVLVKVIEQETVADLHEY